MAYSFRNELAKDSLIYYMDKSLKEIENEEDHVQKKTIYQVLSGVKEKEGNHKQALEYYKLYANEVNKILEEKNSQTIWFLEMQKKYDLELMKNENNRLLIHIQSALLVILVLIVLILSLGLYSYRKNSKNKAALVDAENKINQLKDIADNFDEKEDSFRKIIFEHFDILRKVAILETTLKEDEKKQGQKLLRKFNEIVYKQETLDWNMLYQSMNHLYNNFPDSLRGLYPQLDETDIKLCCLTYAGLSNTEIAVVMELSVNTIQMRKSAIRKKLSIEGYGNFMDFFQKLYSDNNCK